MVSLSTAIIRQHCSDIGACSALRYKFPCVCARAEHQATAEWLACIKPYVNCHTPYGKSNLHQQVQVEGKSQLQKVKDLLDWDADANCAFGPTKMTALHMAVSSAPL